LESKQPNLEKPLLREYPKEPEFQNSEFRRQKFCTKKSTVVVAANRDRRENLILGFENRYSIKFCITNLTVEQI
jgi:hypothetical protein